ncbi:MAG: hypothetical protein CM1200mP9_11100 [Gammaproteobacteria bacterium]|nr:MAG: hypothetical protein CM1200mP9_11100 [Gammaproteobacteria bacterium]
MKRLIVGALGWLFAMAMSVGAGEDWYPSKYGEGDTLGAINNLSPEGVVKAAQLVRTGKTYPLGVVTGPETPAYPPRSFSLTVLQGGDGTGATQGANLATGNDDLMFAWLGVGSQIDGLGHMGLNHVYYNGHRAADFVAPTGLTKLSIDKLPPIVTRGVLIDMARFFGKKMLSAGTVFNRSEIVAQAETQGVSIGKGDVVLFHTGWQTLAGQDNTRFMSGQPGLGVEGAEYLASLGVVAVGSDTWGLEVVPFEDDSMQFPVHPILLAKKRRIYLGEHECWTASFGRGVGILVRARASTFLGRSSGNN